MVVGQASSGKSTIINILKNAIEITNIKDKLMANNLIDESFL